MNKIIKYLIAVIIFGPWLNTSAQYLVVVDGLEYFTWQTEDGQCKASVQKLDDFFLKDGVPQYSGDIVIPSSIVYDGVSYTITGIGYEAFRDCEGLTSITIPSTMERIEGSAFRNDTNLQGVYIDNLKAWCNIKFGNSSYTNPLEYAHDLYLNGEKITDLVVPEGVTEIGSMQFHGSSINSLKIPDGVIEVKINAFGNCRNLEFVELPEGLNAIYDLVFCNCSNLKEITLPSSLEILGGNVFSGCTKLESIVLPPKIKTIEEGLFCGCNSLKSIAFSETITEIKFWAFLYCNSLSEFELPRSLQIVGKDVFSDCYSLPQLALPNEIKSIDNRGFYDSTMWRTINIPETLEALGEAAFPCQKLNILTSRCTQLPIALHKNTPFYSAPKQSVVAAFPTKCLDKYREDTRFSDFMMASGIEKPKINVSIKGDIKLEFTKLELVEEPFFWGDVYDEMTIFAPRGTELEFRLVNSLPEGYSIYYNDTNITVSLLDNTFTLPALTEDVTLEISMDSGVERISSISGESEFYDLQGVRVTELKDGSIYIERESNGSSRKIIKY